MKKIQKKYDYYTPVLLAKTLLQMILEPKISSIIDICCGSWNLLSAASEKYPNAKITGVDIDGSTSNYRITDAEFQLSDGRDYALNKHLNDETYDLILSNPPFGMLSKENRRFIETERHSQYYSGLIGSRYECEMVQANLLLAHNGSVLMFILPSTFVLGETLKKARCQIANDFNINSIIKLPDDTFSRGKINTFAVIMTKDNTAARNPLKLYNAVYNKEWIIEKRGDVEYGHVLKGKWWEQPDSCLQTQKRNVHRGKISSVYFAESGTEVLHCATKKDCMWKPSIRFFDSTRASRKVLYAKQGDIIIGRIGKGAGYWCVNNFGKIPVSDCIIVITDVSEDDVNTLKKCSDVHGRLSIPLRGVATPYITMQDILSIL